MDQKTHLIADRASAVTHAFSEALQTISPIWTEKKRITRQFFGRDPFDRLVPEKLLFEGVEALLQNRARPDHPVVLFMNRGGHGDGAKVAGGLMPLLASHWHDLSFVHVSFNTPVRGLGALVRAVLQKSGAEHGIDVQVACHNRPPEGLRLSEQDAERLTSDADLIISFASSGATEPFSVADPLIARSHLNVLSFPDPEGLVGQLDRLEKLLGQEPNLEAIRFWVQVEGGDSKGAFEDLGTTTLGKGGAAKSELWKLIENARRRTYQVLLEPMSDDLASGDSLVCPCRALLTQNLSLSAKVLKVVPAGDHLIASALGRTTLI
jgi:hypothetical protein